MKNKVLITGAAGFIGSCVVEHMMKTTDFDVYAGIRVWATAARLSRLNPKFIQCNVLNESELDEAISKVDMIVHCAVGSKEVAVSGTRNVLKLAKKYNTKRVVYLSTVDVYGDVEGEVEEQTPYKYTGNAYNEMKIDAEKICFEYMNEGVPIVILRPAIVYGPYSTLWTERMALRINSGKWGTFGKYGNGTCNLTYIYDLSKIIIESLKLENIDGEVFNVVGDDNPTWNEYFIELSRQMGKSKLNNFGSLFFIKTKLFIPIRSFAKYLMSNHLKTILNMYKKYDFAQNAMKIGEKSIKATPTPDELNLYGKKVQFCNSKLKKYFTNLSYTTKEIGISESYDWLSNYGV